MAVGTFCRISAPQFSHAAKCHDSWSASDNSQARPVRLLLQAVKKQAAEDLAASKAVFEGCQLQLEEQQAAVEASGNVVPEGLTDIEVKLTVRAAPHTRGSPRKTVAGTSVWSKRRCPVVCSVSKRSRGPCTAHTVTVGRPRGLSRSGCWNSGLLKRNLT